MNKDASLVAQTVKNLPAMQETWIQSLGQEDPLEKDMQPTPVFLPGEFHEQRSLAGYSPWNLKESDTTEQLTSVNVAFQLGLTLTLLPLPILCIPIFHLTTWYLCIFLV